MNIIKRILKILTCKHEYELYNSKVFNASYPKYYYKKCNKCGKEKSIVKW
jgi:hypothetical protein